MLPELQKKLIDTALGSIPPDLCLKGGTVINVYSGERYEADIAIKGGRIAYVGKEWESTLAGDHPVIDVTGFNLLPGYIEPHGHPMQIHDTIEFTRVASQSGMTAIVADSYKILKALGIKKFAAYTEEIRKRTPVKVYWFMRIFTIEYSSSEKPLYSMDELQELIKRPQILCIGETTRWPAILQKNDFPLRAINILQSAGKRPDGHTSGASGKKLAALAAAGISGCHESLTAEDVRERLRNGMHVMLRHSSQRNDIDNFLEIFRDKSVDLSRFMLTSDGTSPAYLDQNYNIAGIAEELIAKGIDPLTAVRMITVNPASYFRIDHEIGSLTPGRAADIIVTEDYNLSRPQMVLIDGKIIHSKGKTTEKGKALFKASPLAGMRKTYFAHNWRITPDVFTVPAPKMENEVNEKNGQEIKFPVIEMINAIITKRVDLPLPSKNGMVTPGNHELLKIALLDMKKRRVSTGFVKNLADSLEGFASSICAALGVVIVVGKNDAAMALAANRVLELGGGIAVAENGKIIWEIELELPGELTDRPYEEILPLAKELENLVQERGYSLGDFFHTIHFLPCDFLPFIRISTEGLFDVLKRKIIDPGAAE
ncbi:MAG: adenine deaminase [Firmicutes bacterium]|nr:adenine deaminase [Bacillota bacterium]